MGNYLNPGNSGFAAIKKEDAHNLPYLISENFLSLTRANMRHLQDLQRMK